MKLKTFMVNRGLKPEDLAKMFNVSLMSVYRYINGGIPTSRVMSKIIHETGGLVGLNDLVPDNNESISTIQEALHDRP